MTTKTKTHHIPIELLRLIANAQEKTVQVWFDHGDIEFRIWLTNGEHRGVIGGSVSGKYTSVYAISDDGTTNTYCYFDRDGISVTRNPSDRYEPRKEGDE